MSTLGMDEHIISYYLFLVVFIKGAILCFEILYFGRFCKLEEAFPSHFVLFLWWTIRFVVEHYIDISKRYVTRLFATAIKT